MSAYDKMNRYIRDAAGNRYAYQGQEKDPETGKEAFELRLWDSRIGRWLTTDPSGQYHSPYLGMGNNPVNGVDPDGGIWKPNFIMIGGMLLDITVLNVAALFALIDKRLTQLVNTDTENLSFEQKQDLHLRISYLKGAKKRIKEMGENQNYIFELTNFSNKSSGTEVTKPISENTVLIPYDISTIENQAMTVHEFQHGYQVINGFYKISKLNNKYKFVSQKGEYFPEVMAFKFQYAYDPNTLPVRSKIGSKIFEARINSISDITKDYVSKLIDWNNNFVYFSGSGARGLFNLFNNNDDDFEIVSPRYF